MWTSGDTPEKIVKDKGLVQITDTKAIEEIVDKAIADNPKSCCRLSKIYGLFNRSSNESK